MPLPLLLLFIHSALPFYASSDISDMCTNHLHRRTMSLYSTVVRSGCNATQRTDISCTVRPSSSVRIFVISTMFDKYSRATLSSEYTQVQIKKGLRHFFSIGKSMRDLMPQYSRTFLLSASPIPRKPFPVPPFSCTEVRKMEH